MLFEKSKFTDAFDYDQIFSLAKQARGRDDDGYWAEFIRLVAIALLLDR